MLLKIHEPFAESSDYFLNHKTLNLDLFARMRAVQNKRFGISPSQVTFGQFIAHTLDFLVRVDEEIHDGGELAFHDPLDMCFPFSYTDFSIESKSSYNFDVLQATSFFWMNRPFSVKERSFMWRETYDEVIQRNYFLDDKIQTITFAFQLYEKVDFLQSQFYELRVNKADTYKRIVLK